MRPLLLTTMFLLLNVPLAAQEIANNAESRLKNTPINLPTESQTVGEFVSSVLHAAEVSAEIPARLSQLPLNMPKKDARISAMSCLALATENTGYDCLVENDLVVISTAEKIRMIQFSRTHKFTDIPTEKLNIMCKNVRFVLAPDLDGDSPNGSLKFDKKTGIIAVTTDSKTHELVERLFALMALYEREALKQKKRQITM